MAEIKKYSTDHGDIYLGDCLAVMRGLPERSVDLVFGSPPYEDRRAYGELRFDLKGQDWVDWMVEVVRESLRVCKGLVAFVLEGKTEGYQWSATPALLLTDLYRAGVVLRKPPIYKRQGVMGGGGPDWWRNDYEFIVCATNEADRLPWSNNTACGKPACQGVGGNPSHRRKDGTRVNSKQRRDPIQELAEKEDITRREAAKRLGIKTGKGMIMRPGKGRSYEKECVPPERTNPGNVIDCGNDVLTGRRYAADKNVMPDSMRQEIRRLMKAEKISQREACRRVGWKLKGGVSGTDDTGLISTNTYCPPEKANPGNVIDCGTLGGGKLGSNIAHDNEAPFPEKLPDRFIRSFCPPGGVVLDPFGGSGTTASVAVQTGRRFITCDLRPSQIKLIRRRLEQAKRKKGFGL